MELGLLIEEYKSLREELMLHMRFSRQMIVWTSTAFVTICGFLLEFGRPFGKEIASSILYLLLISFISSYQHEKKKVSVIASYIRIFIESQFKELNWTTRNSDTRAVMQLPPFRSRLEASKRILFGPEMLFFLFGILSLLIPITVIPNRSVHQSSIYILLSLMVLYTWKLLFFINKRKYKNKTDKKWQDLKDKENAYLFTKHNNENKNAR